MTIIEILAVVLPAAGSFVYHAYSQQQTRKYMEDKALERYNASLNEQQSRALNKDQNEALIKNSEDIESLKVSLDRAFTLIEEQQTSINRLADKY